MVEVVRVVFHRPADMRVFPELGVETIVIPFAADSGISHALGYVAVPRIGSEREVFIGKAAASLSSGNLSEQSLRLPARFAKRAPAQ